LNQPFRRTPNPGLGDGLSLRFLAVGGPQRNRWEILNDGTALPADCWQRDALGPDLSQFQSWRKLLQKSAAAPGSVLSVACVHAPCASHVVRRGGAPWSSTTSTPQKPHAQGRLSIRWAPHAGGCDPEGGGDHIDWPTLQRGGVQRRLPCRLPLQSHRVDCWALVRDGDQSRIHCSSMETRSSWSAVCRRMPAMSASWQVTTLARRDHRQRDWRVEIHPTAEVRQHALDAGDPWRRRAWGTGAQDVNS